MLRSLRLTTQEMVLIGAVLLSIAVGVTVRHVRHSKVHPQIQPTTVEN